ncbi:hypothetical protein F5Y14DRAFT_464625 [Nemania sp. NC0429]|nr:hypothetical protein F5Y14DRAFT_464625 [Nemania sp. NC0429]
MPTPNDRKPCNMESDLLRAKRLSRRKDGPAFEFINSTGSSRIGSHNGAARATIRRQAARSGRQGHLRENASQDLEDTSITHWVEERAKENAQDVIVIPPRTQQKNPYPRLIVQPSNNEYETMRVVYDFDITTLDSFIDVDLVVKAYRLLQKNPGEAASFLQKGSSSFLAHLPSRYGRTPVLNDVMHCVAAKASQIFGRSTTRCSLSELYMKALRSLHPTKETDPSCSISDIYCATRLLVLYESLGPPDTNALAIHNEYGIKLLRQRGPSRDWSSLDCMLLRSQGPYILTSDIYKNESSMFEAQEWQDLFCRAADMETNADAHYWWRFFGIVTFLPGILKDARALFSEDPIDPFMYISRSCGILERAEHLYRALNESHVLYQRSTSQPESLFELLSCTDIQSAIRVRLQGLLLYPAMFIFRLQATLSLSEVHRARGEERAQRLAAQMLVVEKITRSSDPAMAWHLGQRNGMPYSIIRTREEWLCINEPGGNWEELNTFLTQRWLRWESYWKETVLIEELERAQVECA